MAPKFTDLSPIELLWGILKRWVATMAPRTMDELKEVIRQAWRTIPQGTINRLCAGFATRLQTCLDVEGQSISKLLGPCREIEAFRHWSSRNQNHGPWTAEEDLMIYRKHHELGTRWEFMERFFEGRSAAALKNRWYTVVAKREHECLGNTPRMMEIRARARRGDPVPEICRGDQA